MITPILICIVKMVAGKWVGTRIRLDYTGTCFGKGRMIGPRIEEMVVGSARVG
jgi:hypothetical protein